MPSRASSKAALAQGDAADALDWLTRAAAIFDVLAEASVEQAETRWLLARTRALLGDDEGALADAERAAGVFDTLGEAWRARSEDARAWQPEDERVRAE